MLAKVHKKEDGVLFAPFAPISLGGQPGRIAAVAAAHPSNFDDFHYGHAAGLENTTAADEILQRAREEAAKIIASATENKGMELISAEKTEEELRAQLDSTVADRVADIRDRLTETIDQISGLTDEIRSRAENDLVVLAMQIAKKIVGREVTIDREIALTLVKVSLSKLHNRSVAKVHLNPEDLAFVDAHRDACDFRGALELVEDRSISVGGCLVHTETGDIDARIESQFDEIARGLLN